MKSSAVHRRETAAGGAATVPFLWAVGAVVDITEGISSVRSQWYFVASFSAGVQE
jgi:hypothetical protein